MAKKTMKNTDLKDKRVLVRVDFNVPLRDGVITGDTRIKATLPTINYVLEQDGETILSSHLRRAKTEEDKERKSLAPVTKCLGGLSGREVTSISETRGEQLEEATCNMSDGDVVVFEDTQFEDIDGEKESKNNTKLGKYWALLGDVFVSDAFDTAHRAHASNVDIASIGIPAVAGFLMEKEIKFIDEAVEEPERPMIAALGGTKISGKIGIIKNSIPRADKILIGGGMAYTFYEAKGIKIDNSLAEADKTELAKELIEKAGDKLALPIDNVYAPEFSNDAETQAIEGDIPDSLITLNIGPVSVKLFADTLQGAKTIVWNGPMGAFEMGNFAKDTIGVCEAIASLEGATTIIDGGDSVAAAEQLGSADKFIHISTGGDASLELLKGKELPGLTATGDK